MALSLIAASHHSVWPISKRGQNTQQPSQKMLRSLGIYPILAFLSSFNKNPCWLYLFSCEGSVEFLSCEHSLQVIEGGSSWKRECLPLCLPHRGPRTLPTMREPPMPSLSFSSVCDCSVQTSERYYNSNDENGKLW